ncbi:AAA family ATPase [Microbacterium aquimaris]|uniref:AAA family ATPase n=1 Tax=Microbacterium aquimaris TaxID=459816 RepID=UPI002AD38A82|nr:AAA family ATPase [Microbacterium aquimaris]MDZ8275670.1 AAA family ATPase [Microbacterium aquimaris]
MTTVSPTTDATTRFVDALQARVKVKGAGRDRWRAQCPAHDGTDLNLSVTKGDQGVLVKCWSHDCSEAAIAEAVGLRLSDLFDRDGRAVYDYGNGYRIERRRLATEFGSGKIVKPVSAGITPDVRPLWQPEGSPRIAESSIVFLAEGEKTADALHRLGAPCVATWAGGTGSVEKADYTPLKGRTVVIVPDNDDPGQKAAGTLLRLLGPVAAQVRVWRVPVHLNDAADLWLEGGGLDDLTVDNVAPVSNETPEPEPVDDLEADIADQVRRLLVNAEARARVDAINAQKQRSAEPPAVQRLDTFLTQPDEDAAYRIDECFPTGGNIVIAAQYKAGKSTLIGNLLHALADGTDFLGAWTTNPATRIVLLDNELDPRTLRRWLRAHRIQHPERIDVVSLRGALSTFDILDPTTRAAWAERIGQADVVILDCLRPVLDALGLDENHDAGRFLVAFDELRAAAGIDESVIVHHMGHSGERSRGDSRILDWPDATWRIVRESEDPASPRYFSALGRDVDVTEGRMVYDHDTRTLTYLGGNRRETRDEGSTLRAVDAVADFVRKSPGSSGEAIRSGVEGFARNILTRARDQAVEQGLIEKRSRKGRGGGFAYYPVTPPNPASTPPGEVPNPANPVYKAGLGLEKFENEPRLAKREPSA